MQVDGVGAIVTGGASGLGAATAELLASCGARVTLFDVDTRLGLQKAAEIGGRFTAVDVTHDPAVAAAVAAAAAAHGVARILVNCAGIGPAARTVNRAGAPHDLPRSAR